jgi:hypothetical protein
MQQDLSYGDLVRLVYEIAQRHDFDRAKTEAELASSLGVAKFSVPDIDFEQLRRVHQKYAVDQKPI